MSVFKPIQVLQAGITWKQCTKLPKRLNQGKMTVFNGKVYCGGGAFENDDDEYTVYCYDPSQDEWTTLPPLPVKWFGLGQINGKLVAVGGAKRSDDTTNDIYTLDERARKWKQTISPMPTARHSPGILSLQSALVVAGGVAYYTGAVELFKPDTSQWYRTDPLPMACCNLSLVAIGNICYALGGYNGSYLNQVLFTSIYDLLHNAVPASRTTHSGRSVTQSAWKTLPSTPTYGPAAAVLAGNILATGGKGTSEGLGKVDRKEVYMYSPSTNSWICISDLPAPRSDAAVAVLPSTEILVIGGYCDGDYVNTVYKGSLHLN